MFNPTYLDNFKRTTEQHLLCRDQGADGIQMSIYDFDLFKILQIPNLKHIRNMHDIIVLN